MTYTDIDLELDRIRDQHAAYAAAFPDVRIYALIDPATIASHWHRNVLKEFEALPRVPLYRNRDWTT